MPSRPTPSLAGASMGSVAQTSSAAPPGFRLYTLGVNESEIYAVPSAPTAISLHRDFGSPSAKQPFGAPLARSRIFSQAPLVSPGPGTPKPVMSLEQTYSIPLFSSASTPSTERLPAAPGLMNCSAFPPDAAFTTPPRLKLPTWSVPSLVDVTLSGKLLSGTPTGAVWAPATPLAATPSVSTSRSEE